MFLTEKMVNYIFEEPLNLHTLVGQFPFPLWIPGENRARLQKLFKLNSRLTLKAQYPRYTETAVSATTVKQEIF